MRLSEIIGLTIENRSRARGASYFRSGAVRSLSVENGIIQATVRGTESYEVWIETGGPILRGSCTCPYFYDRADICKHIFAVVLAAEAQAIPLVSPHVDPEDVTIEPVFPDDDDDFFNDDAEEARPVPVPPRLAKPPTPPAPPAWKQLLASVSVDAPPAQGGENPRLFAGQVLFVVDAAASVANNALVLELMTRDRKRNGEWGKPKQATLTATDVLKLADPGERAILERLIGPRPQGGWFGGGWGIGNVSRIELKGAVAVDLVPLLCATGRCMLRPIPVGDAAPKPDPAQSYGHGPGGPRAGAAIASTASAPALGLRRGVGTGSARAGSASNPALEPPRASNPTLTPIAWDGALAR